MHQQFAFPATFAPISYAALPIRLSTSSVIRGSSRPAPSAHQVIRADGAVAPMELVERSRARHGVRRRAARGSQHDKPLQVYADVNRAVREKLRFTTALKAVTSPGYDTGYGRDFVFSAEPLDIRKPRSVSHPGRKGHPPPVLEINAHAEGISDEAAQLVDSPIPEISRHAAAECRG